MQKPCVLVDKYTKNEEKNGWQEAIVKIKDNWGGTIRVLTDKKYVYIDMFALS